MRFLTELDHIESSLRHSYSQRKLPVTLLCLIWDSACFFLFIYTRIDTTSGSKWTKYTDTPKTEKLTPCSAYMLIYSVTCRRRSRGAVNVIAIHVPEYL